jgi:hypothetical protein
MRICIIAVAAATMAVSHAHAAEKRPTTMPISFVGEWCYDSQDGKVKNYKLPSWTEGGHCTKILSIGAYAFSTESWFCEPVNVQLTRDTAPSGTSFEAAITARCQHTGVWTAGSLQKFKLYRYKGNMDVTTGWSD